ncbi:hypothetical protein [Streptomyces sp. NPDC004008]
MFYAILAGGLLAATTGALARAHDIRFIGQLFAVLVLLLALVHWDAW